MNRAANDSAESRDLGFNAADGNRQADGNDSRSAQAFHTGKAWRGLGVLPALLLTALAANCFLKYLWWTACYSAWSGIPKLHDQWKAAGVNASFNGWSFLALEAAAIVILFLAIRLRSAKVSGFLKTAVRLAASLVITVAGTTVFALILSWLKQDVH